MAIQERKIGVLSQWYSDLHVAAVELTDGDLSLMVARRLPRALA